MMASPSRIALRPVEPGDTEFLFRLYASTREEELAVVAWTAEQKDAFLRQQFTAQDQHYREHYPRASFAVVLVEGAPAGRLYVDEWPRELRIVDISLLPAFRGAGMGTALLRDVLARGDAVGKPVSIHVESFNPARRLYARLGFVEKVDRGVYVLMERPAAGGETPRYENTAGRIAGG